MLDTARAAHAWSSSAAGKCRSNTPASSTSTWPCARVRGCSTSATWVRSRWLAGDALDAVQHITSNDAARLAVGQAQYSALTTPEGTFVDDVLTYRLADEHFMLVVNASNIMKDFNWITSSTSRGTAMPWR